MTLVRVEVERNTNTVADDDKIRYLTRYYFVRDGHVSVRMMQIVGINPKSYLGLFSYLALSIIIGNGGTNGYT
jgi:hypothetical protein